MTASVSTSAITLLTTADKVQVNARCAPITSLSSRLTRAPVRVRVKKATGMRCTWANTARRRSRMTPSPMRADCQRSARPTTASKSASSAMTTARPITRLWLFPSTISSTTRPASTGVATVATAPITLRPRKIRSARLCGLAKATMRRKVARLNVRRFCSPCMALSSAIQCPKSICIGPASHLNRG